MSLKGRDYRSSQLDTSDMITTLLHLIMAGKQTVHNRNIRHYDKRLSVRYDHFSHHTHFTWDRLLCFCLWFALYFCCLKFP